MKKLPLKFIWIMTCSAGITAYYSLKTLIYAWMKSNPDTLSHIITTWAKSLLKVIDVRCEVIELQPVALPENTPIIFMSNHLSLYDIPVLLVSLPGTVRMIAKKELFKVPLWGHAMQQSDFVSIDRDNAAQALQDLDLAAQKMKRGVRLWIAPEGTRSHDGQLHAFKKGAFNLAIQTGATIVPITIKGTDQLLPAKTWQFKQGRTVKIYLGEPINARDYTLKDRMKLLQRVREAILLPYASQ